MPERDPAERLNELVDAMLSDSGPAGGAATPLGDLLAVAESCAAAERRFRACLGAELVSGDTEGGAESHAPRTHSCWPSSRSRRPIQRTAPPAGHRGYDEIRRVHNGRVDKRPALIARCRRIADIVEAVNLARTLRLEVAIRGGGHNVAGHATLDGGLMIDLSPMTGIHVDPTTHTARAQGGVTWAEYNRETQAHGLASTGGIVSSAGVAGLTLGGGLGWFLGR